tara:strand:- start:392 stop:994 length:603 start_codon:yes stop_codon:yes gene_type:complete
MLIHTFGDSHSSTRISGWKDCKNVIAHELGALLCYSFGKEKLNRFDIRNYDIKDNDTVIFCLGEIDCRCHIYKHISKEKTYNMIIDEIIENYIDAIELNIKLCNAKLKNICIYNVVPPIEKYNTFENREYPYLGTDEERKSYVLYFNECINKKCKEKNWIYFDIYNNYIDSNGYLRKDLSDGNVHIRNGYYYQKFIEKNL